jgi:hypothetical protein
VSIAADLGEQVGVLKENRSNGPRLPAEDSGSLNSWMANRPAKRCPNDYLPNDITILIFRQQSLGCENASLHLTPMKRVKSVGEGWFVFSALVKSGLGLVSAVASLGTLPLPSLARG